MRRIIFLFLGIAATLCAKEQNPVGQINQWFKAEKEKGMGGFHKFATLATVSSDGHPHTRMIEIVGLNKNKGALFFTHKNTEKV